MFRRACQPKHRSKRIPAEVMQIKGRSVNRRI
ncbi:hypothetical protein BCEP4_170012 [Burkholderia cepacia]|nr:hypothetical protein BCEP4_170012 [Burkholderia cepacia]